MKTVVDADACTGCEVCCGSVPDVYEMDDSGVAIVKVDTVPAELEDDVRAAADDCPAAAITVED